VNRRSNRPLRKYAKMRDGARQIAGRNATRIASRPGGVLAASCCTSHDQRPRRKNARGRETIMDNLLTSFRLFRRDAKQQRHDPARLAQAATHVQRIARGYITRKDFMTCPVCLTITNEPVAISRCGHSVCRLCRGA
jgi:hypothetical protein